MFKILNEDRTKVTTTNNLSDCMRAIITSSPIYKTTNCVKIIDDSHINYSIQLVNDDNIGATFMGTMSQISSPMALYCKIYNVVGYNLISTILDKKEQEYLENLLHPFKKADIKIMKESLSSGNQYISIKLNGDYCDDIDLPTFKEDTMYKNMVVGVSYTPYELGLLL